MTPRGLRGPGEVEGEARERQRIPDPMLPEVGPDHPDAKLVDLWSQRNDMLWPIQLGEVEHDTNEESDAFCEKLTELEVRIATTPAATIVGVGIKSRLLWEHGRHERKATPWTPIEAPGGTTVGEEYALFSVVSDAVRLAMAHSEAARADADLLALEAEVVAAREWVDSHPEVTDAQIQALDGKGTLIGEIETKIAETPAAGLVGAAVKLRRVLDPFIGIEICSSDNHIVALRTALATVERLAKGAQS